MMTQEYKDLVRIATYAKYEEADIARTFLLHRGVAGVVAVGSSPVIEDESDLGCTEGVFDLLVPTTDAAKAVVLLAEEWRLEAEFGGNVELPFEAEPPEDINIGPL